MKTKPAINLSLSAVGILILFVGPDLIGKEFGLAVGFVFLMAGLYGLSRRTGGDPS